MDKRIILLVWLCFALLVMLGCEPTGGAKTGCAALGTEVARDSCFLDRASVEKITTVDLCDNIAGEAAKEKCYEVVFGNSGDDLDCSLYVAEAISDSCNMVVGSRAGPAYCDLIIDLNKRDRCYFEIPKNLDYPEDVEQLICTNIDNVSLKQDCLTMVKKPFGERI